MTQYNPYEAASDRFDVAIRSVMLLFRRGRWTELTTLGLTRKEHEEKLFDAVDRLDSLHTDRGLSQFVRLCPFVLGAALEILRRYAVVTAESRREYYSIQQRQQRKGKSA